jgi:hypothetical protein
MEIQAVAYISVGANVPASMRSTRRKKLINAARMIHIQRRACATTTSALVIVLVLTAALQGRLIFGSVAFGKHNAAITTE